MQKVGDKTANKALREAGDYVKKVEVQVAKSKQNDQLVLVCPRSLGLSTESATCWEPLSQANRDSWWFS